MSTFYLDYVNGNDSADGSTFTLTGLPTVGPWKTITSGPTAARIAPGDIIKIAKSPAPTSLGVDGVWTDGPLPQTKAITSSTTNTPIEITITSHPYVNGDVVFITGHTTNTAANGLWIVTKTGTNTFTLDDSVGNGTGGATGTCNIYSSAVVKLSSTTLINNLCNCDAIWTTADAAKVTCTVDTADWKEGYGSAKFACGATLGVELAAYYTITSVNLSGFRQVSFWIKTSVALAAGDFVIKLCSDTSGVTDRNTISIPALPAINQWTCITVDTAGALYNGIQSVALYQAVDKGAINIWIDNIIACKDSTSADSLSLTSLISLNSAEQGGTEGWYGIQSIKSTTAKTLVVLDNATNSTPLLIRGWAGTNTTATTYKRETIKTTLAATSTARVQSTTENGSGPTVRNEYQGGYDTGTGNQTGETFFDGSNGFGTGLYATHYWQKFNRLSFVRYYEGVYFYTTGTQCYVTSFQSLNNNSYGLVINSANNLIVDVISSICNNYTFGISTYNEGNVSSFWSSNNRFKLISNLNNNGTSSGTSGIMHWNAHHYLYDEITLCANNLTMGIQFDAACHNVIRKIHTKANNRYSNTSSALVYYPFAHGKGGHNLIVQGTIDESFSGDLTYFGNIGNDDRIYVQSTGYCYGEYAISFLQTTTKHGSIGAWSVYISNAYRNVDYPFKWTVARVAAVANVAVTIKVWVKKSHATNIVAKLVIPGLQLAGMDTDITDTKTDDTTDWKELSVQSTQTASGTFEVEVWNYWSAAAAYVYIDSEMTIT
jgi:hypothetical protein